MQKKKDEAAVIDIEKASDSQSEAAVLQGLADARTRAEAGASESGQLESSPEEEQQQQHSMSPNGSHTDNKPAAAQHSNIQEAASAHDSSIDDAEKEGIVSR